MTRLLAMSLLLAIASCQSEGDNPAAKAFAEDSLSLVPPAGWEVKRQKDTLVFVGPAAQDGARATIAVRSVPVGGWSEPRVPDNMLPSVETVLRALPGAKVSGPTWIEHPAYRAAAYDVSFIPRSRGGRAYQRRHVVLFAGEHVFHAFLTGPAGHVDQSRTAFERVLDSLREEA
ncbi:MAG TPA: hypothetical protein VFU21_25635 [Kofleriaceae bacterium]|nr:hypothetical protein [Kofleriaceae bacterium]